MKKTYEKPQVSVIRLQCHAFTLGGSNQVRGYVQGNDITVGDED